MREHQRLFMGGEWVEPAGSGTIDVISPHSEELVGRVPEGTAADIDRAVAAARDAFDNGEWPRLSPEERIAAVQKFSEVYAAHIPDMAAVITEEMGSPITFSNLAQSPAPWMMLNTFLQIAAEYPWEERRQGVLGSDVIVRREPAGVVGAIVPWNVPQFVIMSKLAPALIAGCTIVVKPSPETPLDAFLMAELLDEAGIPKGVVSVVPAGREVGEHLVRHPGVDKIAFTGSTAAGRRIASICGEQLKRFSLELGGKSAALLLDAADLGATIDGLKFASLLNNGMRIAQEEIFGPVLAVIPFDDVDDAVRIANDSDYGLAGSVWTADVDQGLDIARRVRTGTYGINQYTMDFIAPFGGFKGSGIGREFGREGLEHYLELKSIVPPPGH